MVHIYRYCRAVKLGNDWRMPFFSCLFISFTISTISLFMKLKAFFSMAVVSLCSPVMWFSRTSISLMLTVM